MLLERVVNFYSIGVLVL